MNVTKEQIKNGIVRYLENDVVKSITDKPVIMVATVITNMIRSNPKALDKLMDNTIINMMLERNEDGSYNLDSLFDAMSQTIEQYGTFDVMLPVVNTPLRFNKDDVRSLKSYIEGGVY